MKYFQKSVGWIALCFFLAGCSGYRTVNLGPEVPDGGTAGDPIGEGIEPGQRVRVTLTSGERVDGKVVDWDGSTLTAEMAESESLVSIEAANIEEVAVDDGAGGTAAAVVATVFLGIIVAGVVIDNAMDDFMIGSGGR